MMAPASNLGELPGEITEFARLNHQKKLLRDQIKLLNKDIKLLHDHLVLRMTAENTTEYKLIPSAEEAPYVGTIGTVSLKTRNVFDRLSEDKLVKACIDFFRHVMPEEHESEVIRVGFGIAKWVWESRMSTKVQSVERVYKSEKKGKRKKPTMEVDGEQVEIPAEPRKSKKKVKPILPENLPQTREDFFAIPCFQNLMHDRMSFE